MKITQAEVRFTNDYYRRNYVRHKVLPRIGADSLYPHSANNCQQPEPTLLVVSNKGTKLNILT